MVKTNILQLYKLGGTQINCTNKKYFGTTQDEERRGGGEEGGEEEEEDGYFVLCVGLFEFQLHAAQFAAQLGRSVGGCRGQDGARLGYPDETKKKKRKHIKQRKIQEEIKGREHNTSYTCKRSRQMKKKNQTKQKE